MYKTNSSPNLREDKSRIVSRNRHNDDVDLCPQFVIGDRVLVDNYRSGSVAFFGELDFSSGDWVGVVLDEPSGNHDGKMHGREYFHCAPQHGLFVRPQRLRKITMQQQSPSLSSRRATPVSVYEPKYLQNSRASLQSPMSTGSRSSNSFGPTNSGRSTTESYYYDDNNVQSSCLVRPTIESLERKLSLIAGDCNQDEINQRARARSVSASPIAEPVFNFRPQRQKCDDFVRRYPDKLEYEPVRSDLNSNLSKKYNSSMGKFLDFSTNKPLRLHDRILVKSVERQCELSGTLRYLGETNFATGEWAGVELDEPEGRNDGTVLGVNYFNCPNNYGLFVPVSRVRRLNPRLDLAQNIKSTIGSPPPQVRPQSQNSIESSPTNQINGSIYSDIDTRYMSPSSTSSTSPPRSKRFGKFGSQEETNRDSIQLNKSKYNSSSQSIAGDDETFRRASSSAYSSSNQSSLSSPPMALFSSKLKETELDNALKRYTNNRRLKLNNLKSDHNYYTNDNEQPTSCDGYADNHITNHRFQPRSIKYTFKSSKYDGNPIAIKTIEYDDSI